MSEMIERVAKAAFESQDWEFAPRGCFEEQTEGVQEVFRTVARAMLEAMREPTGRMVVHAMIQPHPSVADFGGDILAQGRAATKIDYQAMIDAALGKDEAAA